jgi:ribosomal-protein-alanine N-acetyltransferase
MYDKNTLEKIIKLTLTVILKDGGRLIGWCGLGEFEKIPHETELFYTIAKKFWGKGIGTEIAKAVLEYGLHTVGLKRIVASVNPENTRSVRVLQKAGMKRWHLPIDDGLFRIERCQ